MLIEIVSHCQSIERPYYDSLLMYQLSSLVLYYPAKREVDVRITIVCCPEEDRATRAVLNYFVRHHGWLDLQVVTLSPGRVGRRAIGRNIASKNTRADIVWFTDVDYVFHQGCLESLGGLDWPDGTVMVYPENTMIHRDWDIGTARVEQIHRYPQTIDIKPEEFVHKKLNKAIGGVQIVRGDFARSEGYLPDDKTFQTPTPDGTFVSCRCDMRYRKNCREKGLITKVDLLGVYRLRHPKRVYESPKQRRGL